MSAGALVISWIWACTVIDKVDLGTHQNMRVHGTGKKSMHASARGYAGGGLADTTAGSGGDGCTPAGAIILYSALQRNSRYWH